MVIEAHLTDISPYIENEINEVIKTMEEEANIAVQDAVQSGDYKNHTYTLRTSNVAEVDDDGINLKNTAPYASFVEAKGYNVLSESSLRLEERLKRKFGR